MDNDTRTDTLSTKGFTPYAQIPKWILRNPELSHGAVRLYGVIMSYADNETREAFPGREKLAKDMGSNVRSISRFMAELQEINALEVTRRRNKRTGNYYSNHYALVFSEPGAEIGTPPPAENDPITRPTNLPKPTSSTPPSPAMEKPLSPSPNGKGTTPVHVQLGISKRELDKLVDLTLAFYNTGTDIESDAFEELEEAFEALTGFYVGNAIANKGFWRRLGKRMAENPGRPHYGASKWLGELRNTMNANPLAA